MFFFVLYLALIFRTEDFFGAVNTSGDRYKKQPLPHPGLPASL